MSRALIAIAIVALIPTTAEARAHCRPGQFYRPSLAACQSHPYRAEHVHHAHRMLAWHRPRIIVRTVLHTRVVVRTRTIVRTVVVHDKTPAPVAWANLSRPNFGAKQ